MLYREKVLKDALYEKKGDIYYITPGDFETYRKELRKNDIYDTILYHTKLKPFDYKKIYKNCPLEVVEETLSQSEVNFIKIKHNYYYLTEISNKKPFGYIAVDENKFIMIEKKTSLLPFLLIFFLLLFFLFSFIFMKDNSIQKDPSEESSIPGNIILDDSAENWTGDKPNSNIPKEQENIIIPGFHKFVASESVRDLILYNPPENTVYFIYSILYVENKQEVENFATLQEAQKYINEKNVNYTVVSLENGTLEFKVENKSQKEVEIYTFVEKKDKTYNVIKETVKPIYLSKAIAPGKQIAWDTYSNLGIGNHGLKLKIDTFDIESGKQCYGAIQDIKGVIE